MSKKITDCFVDCVDSILGIRDDIGAQLHNTYLITRTWNGEAPGDGEACDDCTQMLPSPYIIDLSHDVRITQGGAIQQGDLILKNISKHAYPTIDCIDCSSDDKRVEKFYKINDKFYTVIHVKEKHLTWEVHIRKTSDETAY